MLYFQDIHLEIDHLKTMIRKINYPLSFIDSCIMLFIKKLYTLKSLFKIYLKEMLLSVCRSWEVLCFKFKTSLKYYLLVN